MSKYPEKNMPVCLALIINCLTKQLCHFKALLLETIIDFQNPEKENVTLNVGDKSANLARSPLKCMCCTWLHSTQ